jgi:sugar/nucleoside kinase (ribokinase family)
LGVKVTTSQRKVISNNSINPKYVISGQIQSEFVLSLAGIASNDFLGGNLLFAYAGIRYWEQSIGLIGRLSADFPANSLSWLEKMGADISGILQKDIPFEQRSFCAVNRDGSITYNHPLAHYANAGAEFPKILLTFDGANKQIPPAFLESEIPFPYLHSEIALMMPEDLSAQTAILSHLAKGTIRKFVLSPSDEFMYPQYWEDWSLILKNLDVLIISEKNIRSLFNQPQKSLWESIETFFSFGVKAVVVKKDKLAYWIMDKSSHKRWIIPAYPIQAQYPLGSESSFAGGFLYGFQKSSDILEGTLFGMVTESLMAGGVTPPSIFDTLPGLAEARLENLRQATNIVY